MLQEGVWYGVPDVGKPTDLKRRKLAEAALAVARDASLPAFVLDYVADNKSMNDVFRRATKLGATAYPARAKGFGLNKVPKTPRRPYREEAGSILSLKDVNNFIVIRDSSGFGRQDEFALKMHQNNYDMVIVDVQHGDEPLTKQAVETLKYKISGGKRPVLAYINIGAAESYRYYWQSGWGQGSPPWIEMSYPENPDAYYVEFWDPEWQDIIAGGDELLHLRDHRLGVRRRPAGRPRHLQVLRRRYRPGRPVTHPGLFAAAQDSCRSSTTNPCSAG